MYLSVPFEVDTASIALRCWQEGKTVVVPKVSWDQRRMLPVEITSLQTGLTTTGPGVREPIAGNPIPTDLIDLVIVPGLVFDHLNNRLGRGLGFYDRFLKKLPVTTPTIGLAFDFQLIDRLPPPEKHDVPVSKVITN